jgi:hypothetical protein
VLLPHSNTPNGAVDHGWCVPDHDQPSPTRTRRVIHGTCTTHRGARGFANLLVTRVGGVIVLDPHAVGCRIELDETEAAALRDTLAEWLG